jgi:hypothetical protein
MIKEPDDIISASELDRRINELLKVADSLVREEGLSILEDGTITEKYQNPELDELMASVHWRRWKQMLTPDHRRYIRYYRSYLAGECSSMHQSWVLGIEQAIAHIRATLEKQKNQRTCIYDQVNHRYWAGLNAGVWAKTKARALLFTEAEREIAEKYCEVTNKSVGRRQLVLITFDASKRLARESQ